MLRKFDLPELWNVIGVVCKQVVAHDLSAPDIQRTHERQ